MVRVNRVDTGNTIYHVINRVNARMRVFDNDKDYLAFEKALAEAKELTGMRILAYNIMPNHWHLVLYPQQDKDLSKFMTWLSMTHTQRWHVAHNTVGTGHLYQGRYKSFPVQKDAYFIQLCRYVERNPLRAKLVKKAQDWRWSSLWRREKGTRKQKELLSGWPIKPGRDYLKQVNSPEPKELLENIRLSVNKGRPFGKDSWVEKIVEKFNLKSTLNSVGRPRKV